MDRRIATLALWVSALAFGGACSSSRAPAASPDAVQLTGKVLHIQDASDVDGPIVVMIESAPGETIDLYFGSMFTRPPPDQRRRATYEAVRRVRVGDRVRVEGSRMDAGQIWLEQLDNLGRD